MRADEVTKGPVLETRGLTKEFCGFTAVDNVNLQVQEGHIHALIGPNGAGKTTVFNLLTKFCPLRGARFSIAANPSPAKNLTRSPSLA